MELKEDLDEEILTKILCRRKQTELLLTLFRHKDESCANSFFINGNTATGKTYIVKTILSSLKLHYSYINCIEHFTSKLIYQKILKDAGCNDVKTCSTIMDFCRHLKQSPLFETTDNRLYIIFDKAERFRNMEVHLLPAFLRLSELTSLNLCCILISDILLEKFYTTTGFFSPIQIHFEDYSKSDLITIMGLDCPDGYTEEFYAGYCNILVNVFYMVCRDLTELRHLAILNFKKYCEPITNGEIDISEVRKLWQNIVPHLRKALQTVYLREVSSTQWEAMEQSQLLNQEKSTAQVELPYYSKYLLLAAYFSSYNPANTDRRFFVKKSLGRMSKRSKNSAKTSKNVDKKFLGPKPFPIDRLMAIFYSMVEGGASSSANILSQLSTLVTLNLLTRVSGDDQIDIPKYKCIVPLDFAVSVGKQVDMDVMQNLYDT